MRRDSQVLKEPACRVLAFDEQRSSDYCSEHPEATPIKCAGRESAGLPALSHTEASPIKCDVRE